MDKAWVRKKFEYIVTSKELEGKRGWGRQKRRCWIVLHCGMVEDQWEMIVSTWNIRLWTDNNQCHMIWTMRWKNWIFTNYEQVKIVTCLIIVDMYHYIAWMLIKISTGRRRERVPDGLWLRGISLELDQNTMDWTAIYEDLQTSLSFDKTHDVEMLNRRECK